jgi:hypothetical protein
MGSLLRRIFWVTSAGCLLMACGSETPPARTRGVVSPAPHPPPTITLTPDAQTLVVGETVTLRAAVSGDDKPIIVWSPYCESGRVAVAVDPLGTPATITAERAGSCFVQVEVDGQANASTWIRIAPLPFGNACSLDSECAADAPVCGMSSPYCGATCTRTCNADADCPALFKCASSRHLCLAIPYPDDVCP